MTFGAEIVKTTAKKLVSGDMSYEIVVRTNDSNLLQFGAYPADTYFKISIEPDSGAPIKHEEALSQAY